MITEKQIEIAQALINTGLVDKVFHSVELVEDKQGVKFPAYAIGAEQSYVGPDDVMGRFAYIRQIGVLKNSADELAGSCTGLTSLSVPLRIVVFKDHEKGNKDALLQKLLSFTFIKGITLQSVSTNAFQLGKQESVLGKFAFDATTFYVSIDVTVKLLLSSKMCEDDTCIVHPNPICQ